MIRRFAKGRPRPRHQPGVMNKAEAEYAVMLDTRKADGEVLEYWFERFTFKIADDTRYTPDFIVMMPDGTLEAVEIKGFMEDDAFVKLKVFAEMFPFVVRLRTKKAKVWTERVLGAE